MLDVERIKKDFPILDRQVHGRRLVYLDSANTSQKPRAVLDAMERYYEQSNANVHRGTYLIAEEATAALEGARAKVARFIGAGSDREVVFAKNATEALNLVAKAWGRAHLRAGDPVVITELEHHANIVPWHQLVDELGIELRWIPMGDDGHLDLTDLDRLVDGAKVVSFAAMSNVLGTLTPVERLVAAAHAAGAIAVVDASQYVPHVATDVGRLGRRLRRVHRAQDVRSHRHRRAVGHRGDPRRHAPVPHRRRDDPQRHQGGLHAQRAAVEVRGGHAAHRRGGRAWARRSTTCPGSAWRRCATTRSP